MHPPRSARTAWAALLLLVFTHSSKAAETKLFIFWDTVSPDGKYALGWTTTGSLDVDDFDDSEIKNGLVEVASHRMVLVLPEDHYWDAPKIGHRNHYSISTVWSDDSQSLLAIYDSRYSTDQVYLVDLRTRRAKNLIKQLQSAFFQVVRDKAAAYYRRYNKGYSIGFGSPWFVGRDRFEVDGSTFVSKFDEATVDYVLTFEFGNSDKITLVKSEESSGEESDDRELNRVYRSLTGLLTAEDRKALLEQERAWIAQRDAAKSDQEKKDLVQARIKELSDRTDNKIAALRAADGEKMPK
jgi:hypothetical protein